ncbi:pirin family protein [Aequorivita sp. Q41]|uniref:pirin family protein n=1 Tax=Aequorivita sp. Q41 TaxID=3153300 RepID=UPI003242FB84
MDIFLLKSKNRISEKKGAFNIHYCYDKEKNNLSVENYFKNLVSIKDFEIKPNMGILPHKHKNIELITFLIEGKLTQKNNLGETYHLASGNMQIMSAGTGVSHFEYNESTETTLNCIQFSIAPHINYTKPKNHILTIETNKTGLQEVIPYQTDTANPKVMQDIYLHYGFLETNTQQTYPLKNTEKGILILNISGEMTVNGEVLEHRDTLVLKNIPELKITSNTAARFLLFEI